MAKRLTSNHIKHAEQNDDGQADELEQKARHYWNSKILAFEWWEPAPDGFCSAPGRKYLRNPKP